LCDGRAFKHIPLRGDVKRALEGLMKAQIKAQIKALSFRQRFKPIYIIADRAPLDGRGWWRARERGGFDGALDHHAIVSHREC
jgi:hypothetical protein